MNSPAASPALRIKFIQAAKEGNLEQIKKFINDGIPVNTVDNCGVCFILTLFVTPLGICTWKTRDN